MRVISAIVMIIKATTLVLLAVHGCLTFSLDPFYSNENPLTISIDFSLASAFL